MTAPDINTQGTCSFWQHLTALSEAHKALEKECEELRSEMECARNSVAAYGETLMDSCWDVARERIPPDQLRSDDTMDGLVHPSLDRGPGVSMSMRDGTCHGRFTPGVSKVQDSTFEPTDVLDLDSVMLKGLCGDGTGDTSDQGASCEQVEDAVGAKWANLVLRATSLIQNANHRLLSCWKPGEDSERLLVEDVCLELGSQTQDFDPIVQEWCGWKGKKLLGRRNSTSMIMGKMVTASTENAARKLPSEKGELRILSCRCGVLHPLTPPRLLWSVIGFVFVAYDGLMISLSVFDMDSSSWVDSLDWFLRVFWAVDLCVCFRTGFYVNGRYEGRSLQAIQRYLKSWFIVDFLAWGPDVVIALVETKRSGLAEYITALRWIKQIKLLRLLRAAKLSVMFTNLVDSLNSIWAVLMLHLVKYSLLVFVWVHVCGCAWYLIGKRGDSEETSWILKAKVDHLKLPRIYFVSVQWALSLFQGGTDIYPSYSSKEQAFTIAMVMASLFTMAIFISNITNILIQLQTAWDERAKQMRALQEYLHRHEVSPDVSESVRKYAEHKLKIERKLQLGEDDVTSCLPKVLRRTLLVEVRGPMVNVKNPVFPAIQIALPLCFEKICCDMLKPSFVEPDTPVYNYAEQCNTIYFNVAGELVYDHVNNLAFTEWLRTFDGMKTGESRISTIMAVKETRARASMAREDTRETGLVSSVSKAETVDKKIIKENMLDKESIFSSQRLNERQPICEPALWTNWQCKGDLCAISHAAFITLQLEGFSRMVEHFESLRCFGVCHAVRFCRVLNSGECQSSDLLTSVDVLTILQSFGEVGEKDIHRMKSNWPPAFS